jgi:Zn-dependent protease
LYRYFDSGIKSEVEEIAIAVTVLTVSYSILIFRGYGFHISSPGFAGFVLGESFAASFTAFFLHELAHRQVGRKLGYYTRFRLWPFGIILAFITSFLGFLFGALGAVNIYNSRDHISMGKIAAAGPATNLGLGLLFFFLGFGLEFSPAIAGVAFSVSTLNFYLGAFNMIPIGPLDGQKVLAWNLRNYILLFAPLILMTVISFSLFGL